MFVIFQLKLYRVINLQQEGGRSLSKEAPILVSYPGCSVTDSPAEQEVVGTKYIHELPLVSTHITEILRLFSDLTGSWHPTDASQCLCKVGIHRTGESVRFCFRISYTHSLQVSN